MRTPPKIVIDPGHGGKDPGGGSNNLFLEKDLALAISLYQADRFRQLGVKPLLTRTEDVYLSPLERARIVRDSGAAFCISNHINAGGGTGAETIHSIHADGMLARRIADAIREEGQPVRRVFTRTFPGDPTRDYYYMHRDTGAVETIIVEYGFADSPGGDAERLTSGWRRYGEAVVRACCRHAGHPYAPPSGQPIPPPSVPSAVALAGRAAAAASQLPALQRRIDIVAEDGAELGAGFLIDGVAYGPIRLLAGKLGAEADWDGERVVLRRIAKY